MWATAFDKDEVRRDVTPHDVVRAVRRRYKPVLFFEEIDKRRLTPFGADIYFRLIDAIDQGLGQLIVTSNLDMAGLTEMLTQADVKTTGEAILRRLGKLNIRDYWKET
jgi:DNA replication protein DnaC